MGWVDQHQEGYKGASGNIIIIIIVIVIAYRHGDPGGQSNFPIASITGESLECELHMGAGASITGLCVAGVDEGLDGS
jgi:hypothetical protein